MVRVANELSKGGDEENVVTKKSRKDKAKKEKEDVFQNFFVYVIHS